MILLCQMEREIVEEERRSKNSNNMRDYVPFKGQWRGSIAAERAQIMQYKRNYDHEKRAGVKLPLAIEDKEQDRQDDKDNTVSDVVVKVCLDAVPDNEKKK